MALPSLHRILAAAPALEAPDRAPCTVDAPALQAPCKADEPAVRDPVPSPWERATDVQRTRALARLRAVERSDACAGAGRSRAEADAIAAVETGVSASAVGAWRRRVEGMPAGARAAALLDTPGRGRSRRDWSGAGADALWTHWLTDYLRAERPTAARCWREVSRIARRHGWAMPPLHAFLRRLKREIPKAEQVRARDGAIAAMDLVPHVTRTVAGLYPLAIVNGDGKIHDCWAMLPSGRAGRPVVWYWQDVYTRRILAWAAGETESAELIRRSLHEVITVLGLPGRVVLDNTRAASAKEITGGKANRKRNRGRKAATDGELPGVLEMLEISYSTTSVDMDAAGRGVGRGRAKPIERAFRDLCGDIDSHPLLAGAATGRSPLHRPETHRSRAAPWETFLAVVAESVAEHNARPGRATEIAAGRSFDEAWNEAMAGTVVRRISEAQARILLLSAERVKIGPDGSFALKAGRVRHRPPNRYHDIALVDHAGERLVARFDPADLHEPCQVYDDAGRWLCRAACLLPATWRDTAGPARQNRARRRMERASRKALETRRDMEALLDELAQAPVPASRVDAAPAAVRLVTGKRLPEVPSAGRGDGAYRTPPAQCVHDRPEDGPTVRTGGRRMTQTAITPFPGLSRDQGSPGDYEATVAACRAELEATGLSQPQAAHEMGRGVSEGVLSKWLRGVYRGDVPAVTARVATWLETRAEARRRDMAAAGLDRHVELGVTEEIEMTLAHAQATGDRVLIHGRSGCGKSWAAMRYCASRTAAYFLPVTPVTTSMHELMSRVADTVDAGSRHRSAAAAESAIATRLKHRRALLCVDEAHHLGLRQLDELRRLADPEICGFGLALVGGDELWTKISSAPGADQIVDRVGIRLPLGLPAAADVRDLARGMLGRAPTKADEKSLVAAARGPGGLHALRRLLGRAWVLARAAQRERIAPDDLAAAAEAI